MRRSIAQESLTKTITPIDEDQKVDLLHAPFKGTTLFGGDLGKLQKANTERASAPCSESALYLLHPTQPYLGWGRSLNYYPSRRGGYLHKRGG